MGFPRQEGPEGAARLPSKVKEEQLEEGRQSHPIIQATFICSIHRPIIQGTHRLLTTIRRITKQRQDT